MDKATLKKKKREKRIAKQKHYTRELNCYREKYPTFIVTNHYADIELERVVKLALSQLNWRNAPAGVQEHFRDIKHMGGKDLVKKYEGHYQYFIDFLNENYGPEYTEQHKEKLLFLKIVNQYAQSVKDILYESIRTLGIWDKFFPLHEVFVSLNYDGNFEVELMSFIAHHSGGFGADYFHNSLNKVEKEGKQYTLCFTKHTLGRMTERFLGGDKYRQDSLITVMRDFIFKADRLTDGVDVVVVYYHVDHSLCAGGSMPGILAHTVTGKHPHKFDMKLGYFPCVFMPDGFVHLKTFLNPGMSKTPEKVLIDKVDDEKKRLHMIEVCDRKPSSMEELEVYKYFHDNGCPQIENISYEVPYEPKEKQGS